MPEVSVIVPIYNSEKTLASTLDNLAKQTYNDYEVLLVDDGSTDKSGEICDFYAENDKRFRVFHQPNSGVSVARNLGIQMSESHFICFVDSDDYVDEKYIQCLYSIMSSAIDLGICCVEIVTESGGYFLVKNQV